MAELFRRWVNKLVGERPRMVQHQLDVLRLFVATRAHDLLTPLLRAGVSPDSDEYKAKTEQIAEQVNREADALQHLQRRQVVSESITEQLRIRLGGSKDERPSFSVHVEPSAVHGHGVFVRGYAPPGSLLAIYPGIVYMPLDMKDLPHYPYIGKNPNLFVRFDDLIIDPDGYEHADVDVLATTPTVLSNGRPVPLNLKGKRDMSRVPRSALGVGHRFNHPPEGTQPGVLTFALDVPDTFPPELAPLIPNRYYKAPTLLYLQSRCIMRTVALVSTKHLKDEEVFLNYRYNPNLPELLPKWYHHVDREEAERIWAD